MHIGSVVLGRLVLINRGNTFYSRSLSLSHACSLFLSFPFSLGNRIVTCACVYAYVYVHVWVSVLKINH